MSTPKFVRQHSSKEKTFFERKRGKFYATGFAKERVAFLGQRKRTRRVLRSIAHRIVVDVEMRLQNPLFSSEFFPAENKFLQRNSGGG